MDGVLEVIAPFEARYEVEIEDVRRPWDVAFKGDLGHVMANIPHGSFVYLKDALVHQLPATQHISSMVEHVKTETQKRRQSAVTTLEGGRGDGRNGGGGSGVGSSGKSLHVSSEAIIEHHRLLHALLDHLLQLRAALRDDEHVLVQGGPVLVPAWVEGRPAVNTVGRDEGRPAAHVSAVTRVNPGARCSGACSFFPLHWRLLRRRGSSCCSSAIFGRKRLFVLSLTAPL